jgi:phosphoglycerate transport regulatory protein PgtC
MTRLARIVCLVSLAILSAGVCSSESIVVASSFPKEVLLAYKKAFDERHPQYRVEFVTFPATNIVPFLLDRTPGTRPDVYWSTSIDSFRSMSRQGLLQSIAERGNPDIPARIGDVAIDDPAGFYKGQALSGFGIMWNTRYLAARSIAPPATWSDLARPEYFGHLVMSSPSLSGTTHLIVESILQGAGWDQGWSLILQIAGNCATITDRSFGVPSNITSGRFGIGLVVDFLALSGKYSGFPVDFSYAWPSVITAASIGLISGARNSEGGLKFIDFALSKEGQSLLLKPEISRLPVLPDVYASPDRPADYPNPFEVIRKYPQTYSASVAGARYLMVGAIFDQVITFRHAELVAATRILQDVERQLSQRPQPEAEALIRQARELIYRIPVAEQDELMSNKPLRTRSHIAAIAEREAEWVRQTRSNHVAAKILAERALGLIRSSAP